MLVALGRSAVRALLPAALLVLVPGSSAAQAAAPVLADSLRVYAERVSRFGVSGALLVARYDTVLLETGLGTANDAGDPVTADMPFAIGSISKTITAAAILKLKDQGRLALTDSIGHFFAGVPAPLRSVRISELLTHTGGLPYLEGAGAIGGDGRPAVQQALAVTLNPTQRGTYAYSNPGYTILGGIIEKVSGTSYEDYIRTGIFAPAGMTKSGFLEERERWRATPLRSYSGSRDEGTLAGFPAIPSALGSGSIVSTVGDLYRFVLAFRDGRLVDSATADAALTRQTEPQGPSGYGYGWNVAHTVRGTRIALHGGDLGGYNSELRLYLDEDIVTVFLSNRRVDGVGYKAAVMNPLALRIAGAPHPAPPPLSQAPLDTAAFPAGDYVLQGGGTIHVRHLGGLSQAGLSGQDAVTLFTGMAAELASTAALLNERAQVVLDSLRAGGTGPLRAALTPALPADGMAAMITDQIGTARAQLGALTGVVVLGTTMRAPNAGTTAFRLQFERGARIGQIGWAGEHILDIDLDRTLPLAALLAPAADGGLVAFDPFTGATTWLEAVQAPGRPPLLRLRNGSGQTAEAELRQN